jgi:septal ring factor EnvC (AmiA/AmiB activator)
LIEVCKKVEDPDFVEAALKLSRIEDQTGREYHQVISDFEKAQKELPQIEERVIKATAQLKSINDAIFKSKQELDSQEKHLRKYRIEDSLNLPFLFWSAPKCFF